MRGSRRFWSTIAALGLLGFSSVKALDAVPLPVPGQPVPTYTLADCLRLALDRNPSILKAQHDIERTEGLVITAKSVLFPQVTMNGRIEKRNDDLFKQGPYPQYQGFRDYWTIQLAVTQSLYSGGTNRQQIAIAKLQHEASLIQFQATIDQVLRDVKYAAYTIVVNQAQIAAEEKTVDLLKKEGTRQQELFDAGRTTRFNILRTKVNLGNQLSVLSQTRNALIGSQIALAALLNIDWSHTHMDSPFNPPFLVNVDLDCPPVGQINVEDFIALALSRRPELKVLDRQIDIGERQIKVDRAVNLPRIYGYVADEDARDQNLPPFDKTINDYAIGLLGTWDIFDGFSAKGQVMSDSAALKTTHLSRDAMQLQIQNEVRESYARLLSAKATIQSEAVNVKTAEESVGLAQLSAETGYATLLDVLQATIDLTSARTEEIRTRQLYMDALADLERAVSLKFVDWPANKDGSGLAPSASAQSVEPVAPLMTAPTIQQPPATNAPAPLAPAQ